MNILRKAFIIAAAIALAATASAQSNKRMAFDSNKQFKIAQFTDIHWCDDSTTLCQRTLATMQAVINAERPDLILLTGDIVTDHPAVKGWESIINFFHKQGIPYAVTMGNHDAEFLSKDSIYTMLTNDPVYVGVRGNQVSGYGNMTIALHASDGSNKVNGVIYLIDSNDYPTNNIFGHYDWIHFDQLEWYRRESDRFAAANNGKPVPSLAYFHIPLMEYAQVVNKPDTFGTPGEGVAAGGVNSGFFAQVLDKGDIMGIFAGHDHMNDFIGLRSEVALAFGRCSGWNAYGTLQRGARIVLLQEGKRHFDTWITTEKGKEPVYHYPSGINSIDESGEYLKASNISPKKNGVAYTYYEGAIKSCKEVDSLKPLKKGTMSNFNIDQAAAEDHFAYDFNTLFYAPEKAVYKFRMRSDDGAQLTIDSKLVIDNDGSHSANYVVGIVALEAGYHHMHLRYFEDYMGQELKLRFQTPNIDEQPVTDDMLFVPNGKN
ncbi:MAG: PA14 domain-containing protein [Muribaculaceae bacterium]